MIDEKKSLVAERDNYQKQYETAQSQVDEYELQNDVDSFDELKTPLGSFKYIMPDNLDMATAVENFLGELKRL